MRRRFYESFEITVFLGDPTPEDEAAIRALSRSIAEFLIERVSEFPWPVDVTLTSTVDREDRAGSG